MSSNVLRISERAAAAQANDYLGPAEVTSVDGAVVFVELPESRHTVRAEMALAFPYESATGDTLLVIGKGAAYYVIGVLRGAGRSALTMPGDVALHAEGSLSLSANKGVSIKGREVEVYAEKIQVAAQSMVQTFKSLYQRASDLLSVHARQSHTLVDDAMYTQAKSAAIVTEETVTINGSEVHLG